MPHPQLIYTSRMARVSYVWRMACYFRSGDAYWKKGRSCSEGKNLFDMSNQCRGYFHTWVIGVKAKFSTRCECHMTSKNDDATISSIVHSLKSGRARRDIGKYHYIPTVRSTFLYCFLKILYILV